MTTTRRGFNRRRFLGILAAATASSGLDLPLAYGLENPRRSKTILSFYCDDTSPYVAGADAFKTFLDFCAEQRIAGESSCILGMNGHSMCRKPNEQEQAFLRQVERAWRCGIGTHMELPNAMDHFGIWENNPDRVDPDYYITADGKSGIIVRRVEAKSPYCVWYSHWQGLNPAKGVGWQAFTTVVGRIRKHLADRVVWMRPSDITDRYHQSGGWNFLETL